MIIVFDSCVWISAVQFRGTPLAALDEATKRHEVAICTQILSEIDDVLQTKFRWTEKHVKAFLATRLPDLKLVSVPGRLRGVCRDPKDDMVIECAVAAGAGLIVSGDKDLLALGRYEGIRIVTPREFLQLVETQKMPYSSPPQT